MTTLRVPTEEETRAIARQGEDAVVAMVGEMLQVIAQLSKRVGRVKVDDFTAWAKAHGTPYRGSGWAHPIACLNKALP